MNRVARHRLTTLISAMCIPALLVVTTPTPASASATTSTNDARSAATSVEHRFTVEAEDSQSPVTPTLAALSCPSGWFCFYEETDFGNPYGKLSSCGWQSLADFNWSNRVEAAYYNLSTGSASFYESNGTYLFQVSAANRSLSDVGSKQNKADKVYRAC
jgi:hypothetical protein